MKIISHSIYHVDSSEILKPVPAGQSISTDGTVSAEPGRYCIEDAICEEWTPGNYTIVVGKKYAMS